MSEQPKEEKSPTQESLEDQKYKELQDAEDRKNQIMKEIGKVFESTPDRVEAEKIVLENWATLMDEAMRKYFEAFEAWLEAMRESHERAMKKLDEIEKDLEKE